MNTETTKILIVVFDALRPEFVRPGLMPNLSAFAKGGVRFENSRSTFPTETRVNQTAVLTGCYPRKHGIVGNKFPDADIFPDRVIDTGINEHIVEAFAKAHGGLIKMPTLGERLALGGRRYAALSAGTPGGGRLINHAAEQHGSFRLAMRSPEATTPASALTEILKRIGPLPDYELPAIDWITWAVDAYLQHIVRNVAPDVMLLWLCEPDENFHFKGIGSDDSLTTIRHVDAEFGRILKAQKNALEAGGLQIIAMSDHGQISLDGQPLDLPTLLNDAGFAAATAPGPHVDYTVVVGNAGGIWARGRDDILLEKIIAWLIEQPWCGPIFSRTGAGGTLKIDEICADHGRAPDLYIMMRSADAANAWGVSGTTPHDAPYPVGGGCHGGLSSFELQNVLTMAGTRFKTDQVVSTPAGNIDILPTIFYLLGMEQPTGIDGRPLMEAICDQPDTNPAAASSRLIKAPNGQTQISVTDFGEQRYLNKAWAT
ncbi:MAG: alkaline phosphatase family protein [Geminicoccaceae bacterium]